MSNKQALRELQQRLAQRMQAAREQAQSANWLAVEAGGAALLLPLRQSSEIFTPVPLRAVPYAQPWLLGVANLRGGLHTVVDLAAFLGLREPTAARSDGARLVTLNPDLNVNCALLVDRLLGLRSDDQLQALETPAHDGTRPRFAGGQWRDAQGRRWQALDLESLARHEQFLRIVA